MKQLLLILLLWVCMPGFSQKQTKPKTGTETPEKVNPPQVVLDKFVKEFPNITPSWRLDGDFFVAEFMDPLTLKGSAIVYDKDANVIRRENEIENSSYPQSINDFFIKQYPGEKYRTWSSIDKKGVRSYFIKRSSETVWFDTEGKRIEVAGN